MTASMEWFNKAKAIIPGGVHSPVRSFKHVGIAPIYFDRAQGATLVDVDGKSYTDFCLAFGPHLLGHCPAEVVEALKMQADKATSFGACHPREVELAQGVLKAYPFLDQVRLVNSGTEAVMTAVRIARGFTGRSKVVQFEGCYHGHSDGFLAKAGSGVAFLSESASRGVPSAIVSETLVARLDDLDAFELLLKTRGSEIAAVVLEPVPANNGLWIPKRETLLRIVDATRAAGAVVLFDEVITGFRLGLSGASGYFDLQPDLVTLGKILGGGLPVAAVAGRKDLMEQLAPVGGVYQAGTLSGNPMGTAAGCAVLDRLFQDPPYEELASRTEAFASELEARLGAKTDLVVRRIASLFWISFGNPGASFPMNIDTAARERYADFFKRALHQGVYLAPSPYEVGFLSTAHSESLLAETVEKLVRCVD